MNNASDKNIKGADLTAFEQDDSEESPESYVLCLYVTGSTPKSIRAIANLRNICETYLEGRYDLEVVDLYQQPDLAMGNHIVAVPTLVKKLPVPLRRIIGDMSDTKQLLIGLNLRPKR